MNEQWMDLDNENAPAGDLPPPPCLDDKGNYIKFSLLKNVPFKTTNNSNGDLYDRTTKTGIYMTELQKLIENGGWLDIAEVRDDFVGLLKATTQSGTEVTILGAKELYDRSEWTLTHAMPLEHPAKIAGIAADFAATLRNIRDGEDGRFDAIKAHKALERAEKDASAASFYSKV